MSLPEQRSDSLYIIDIPLARAHKHLEDKKKRLVLAFISDDAFAPGMLSPEPSISPFHLRKPEPIIPQAVPISQVRVIRVLMRRPHVSLEVRRHVDNLTEVIFRDLWNTIAFLLCFVAGKGHRSLESCCFSRLANGSDGTIGLPLPYHF